MQAIGYRTMLPADAYKLLGIAYNHPLSRTIVAHTEDGQVVYVAEYTPNSPTSSPIYTERYELPAHVDFIFRECVLGLAPMQPKTKLSPAALACLAKSYSGGMSFAGMDAMDAALERLIPGTSWAQTRFECDAVPDWQNPFTAGYGANIPAYLAYLRQELQV